MILIAHRGNLNGKTNRENQPEYIQEALVQDFDAEIDVWYVGGEFWLGHDRPRYKIEENFLENPRLWCHAKSIITLYKMSLNSLIHCFWHSVDDVVLTSRGYLWTYPGKELTKKSICVVPEKRFEAEMAGVCSNNIKEWI